MVLKGGSFILLGLPTQSAYSNQFARIHQQLTFLCITNIQQGLFKRNANIH